MTWFWWLVIGGAVLSWLLLKRRSLVPARKACGLLRQGALIVDVREPDEFASAHLPGAMNIRLAAVGDEVPRRVPDRDRPLLLHCVSGMRSGIATRQVRGLGYGNAFNLGSYGRAARILRQSRVP